MRALSSISLFTTDIWFGMISPAITADTMRDANKLDFLSLLPMTIIPRSTAISMRYRGWVILMGSRPLTNIYSHRLLLHANKRMSPQKPNSFLSFSFPARRVISAPM